MSTKEENSRIKHNVKCTMPISAVLASTVGFCRKPCPIRTVTPCPQCLDEYSHEAGLLLICPNFGHEWSPRDVAHREPPKDWKDTNGQAQRDRDRDHDIDCPIDGFGPMQQKTAFVKKSELKTASSLGWHKLF